MECVSRMPSQSCPSPSCPSPACPDPLAAIHGCMGLSGGLGVCLCVWGEGGGTNKQKNKKCGRVQWEMFYHHPKPPYMHNDMLNTPSPNICAQIRRGSEFTIVFLESWTLSFGIKVGFLRINRQKTCKANRVAQKRAVQILDTLDSFEHVGQDCFNFISLSVLLKASDNDCSLSQFFSAVSRGRVPS